MNPKKLYVQVAVKAPLMDALTYEVSLLDFPNICLGMSVEVPLGKRKVIGLVVSSSTELAKENTFKVKSIIGISQERPILNQNIIKWLVWLSDYYRHPIGQVCEMIYPPLKKKGRSSSKKIIVPEIDEAYTPPDLNEIQKSIVSEIRQSDSFGAHYLYGVTGSGKTEVYIDLIKACLQKGKSAFFLVPEISLTPQLIFRFAQKVGKDIAVIHSHLTDREKTDQWWLALEGKKKLLIGARSALFCPLPNLGLIILDEEHESSFKQDEKLKYHARDAALMRASIEQCPVIMGSATPSIEAWNNIKIGKYKVYPMKQRIKNIPLPNFEVVNIQQEKNAPKLYSDQNIPFWMSKRLFDELSIALDKNEQAALFLNRRGLAKTVINPVSGESPKCPNCEISLCLHSGHYVVCHYCDYSVAVSKIQEDLGGEELVPLGLGTELIEKDLQVLFSHKKIARADRDEISNRADLEALIESMEKGDIDILVGTQMIAKGLDFKNLNLVGIVLADIGFNMPDFRALEKSFQLITQVGGRAGRHLKEGAGRVIVQTFSPENQALKYAVERNFEDFANYELNMRKKLFYPPFSKMVRIRFESERLEVLLDALDLVEKRYKDLSQKNSEYSKLQKLGPAQSPLAKLRNKYRYFLIIKASDHIVLNKFLKQLCFQSKKWLSSRVKMLIDVDPYNMM